MPYDKRPSPLNTQCSLLPGLCTAIPSAGNTPSPAVFLSRYRLQPSEAIFLNVFFFFACLLSVFLHRIVNSRRQGHVCLIHYRVAVLRTVPCTEKGLCKYLLNKWIYYPLLLTYPSGLRFSSRMPSPSPSDWFRLPLHELAQPLSCLSYSSPHHAWPLLCPAASPPELGRTWGGGHIVFATVSTVSKMGPDTSRYLNHFSVNEHSSLSLFFNPLLF